MDLETKSLDDTEIDTPPSSHKLLSFSNGAFKSYSQPPAPPPPSAAPPTTYKECMKNHAASIGGHAVDGCCEFMPSPSSTPSDPTSLKCAACGCHRNFHRRETAGAITPPFLDFRHPPLPKRFSLSPSPPPQAAPISYAVFTEAAPVTPTTENHQHVVSRKRFRTKFSQDQKKRMHWFSEKMGWKMQKTDEAAVEEFCREIGVGRGVLKVWMHNNKNTFGKKEMEKSGSQEEGESNGGGSRSEETRIDQDRRCFGNSNSNGIHFQESNNYSRASSSQ